MILISRWARSCERSARTELGHRGRGVVGSWAATAGSGVLRHGGRLVPGARPDDFAVVPAAGRSGDRPCCYVGLVSLLSGRSDTTASLGGRGSCGLVGFPAALMM